MVSSLGPAGEPVEPENWGPLLSAAPLGVEAQRDRQPIGCVLTGAWQGGVSVRSDQTRPHACEHRLALLDKEPQRRRMTGGGNSTVRQTGPSTGIDMPADTRGLGLGNATLGVPHRCWLALGTAYYRGDGTSGQLKNLSVWTTADANAANHPRRPDRMIACQNMS